MLTRSHRHRVTHTTARIRCAHEGGRDDVLTAAVLDLKPKRFSGGDAATFREGDSHALRGSALHPRWSIRRPAQRGWKAIRRRDQTELEAARHCRPSVCRHSRIRAVATVASSRARVRGSETSEGTTLGIWIQEMHAYLIASLGSAM
jgi:hypothetical protein